jgi:hemerythrin-like metal-binding protein
MHRVTFKIPRAGIIGLDAIDDEHEEVVECLDFVRLHIEEGSASNLRKTREACQLLLAHFKSEERLMQSHSYPHLAHHVVHHDQTLGAIYRILGNCEHIQAVGIEDLRELFRVLIDDIFSADIAFSSYLARTGVIR